MLIKLRIDENYNKKKKQKLKNFKIGKDTRILTFLYISYIFHTLQILHLF